MLYNPLGSGSRCLGGTVIMVTALIPARVFASGAQLRERVRQRNAAISRAGQMLKSAMDGLADKGLVLAETSGAGNNAICRIAFASDSIAHELRAGGRAQRDDHQDCSVGLTYTEVDSPTFALSIYDRPARGGCYRGMRVRVGGAGTIAEVGAKSKDGRNGAYGHYLVGASSGFQEAERLAPALLPGAGADVSWGTEDYQQHLDDHLPQIRALRESGIIDAHGNVPHIAEVLPVLLAQFNAHRHPGRRIEASDYSIAMQQFINEALADPQIEQTLGGVLGIARAALPGQVAYQTVIGATKEQSLALNLPGAADDPHAPWILRSFGELAQPVAESATSGQPVIQNVVLATPLALAYHLLVKALQRVSPNWAERLKL